MLEKLQKKLSGLTTEQQKIIESALTEAAEKILEAFPKQQEGVSQWEFGGWEPQIGEEYWYYSFTTGVPVEAVNPGIDFAYKLRVDAGNIHKNLGQALCYGEIYRAKREYIRLARESWGSEHIDWKNSKQCKYYALFGLGSLANFEVYENTTNKEGKIYFKSESRVRNAVEKLGGPMVLAILDFPW